MHGLPVAPLARRVDEINNFSPVRHAISLCKDGILGTELSLAAYQPKGISFHRCQHKVIYVPG